MSLLTVDRFSDLMSRTMFYNKRLFCKTIACTSSFWLIFIALNQIWSPNVKSLNVSRSISKHFEVSVSQCKKSKCLGLAKKNASLAVSQSLAFTIRHPFNLMTSWGMVSDKVIVVSADRILKVLNVSSRLLGCYNKRR